MSKFCGDCVHFVYKGYNDKGECDLDWHGVYGSEIANQCDDYIKRIFYSGD